MFDKTVINNWLSSVYSYRFVILAQGREWIIQALAICFLYSAPAVVTNRTRPGRSVSNHDNKAEHFVWRYHRLIYCDNSAETPVKKAEGHKLHFCIVTRLIQFLFNLVTTRTEISACNPNLAKNFSAFLNLPGTRIFLP